MEPLTDLDDHGDGGACLLVPAPRPRRHHGALAHLLLRLLRDEDAALRLGRSLGALDQHAVEQRQESLQGPRLKYGGILKENCGNWNGGIT